MIHTRRTPHRVARTLVLLAVGVTATAALSRNVQGKPRFVRPPAASAAALLGGAADCELRFAGRIQSLGECLSGIYALHCVGTAKDGWSTAACNALAAKVERQVAPVIPPQNTTTGRAAEGNDTF